MPADQFSVQQFTESFFQRLKCETNWEGPRLKVNNVPKGFEAFVGKKGPYTFAFNPSDATEKTELLTKGGFFLNAMANYLKSASKTTLIRLTFPELDPKSEIETRFTFPNASLGKIKLTHQFDYLVRFTFSTTFQYLNKKDHENNTIFVKDEKIINFPLEKYTTTDGKKKDIEIDDLKNLYEKAQDKIKQIIREKTKTVSESLSEKMKKEIARIEKHYNQQIKEFDLELENTQKAIEKTESQIEKTQNSEEASNLSKKLTRLKAIRLKLTQDTRKKELEKEKEFIITDEKRKYSLNVNNSLINTSIIYYPIFTFHTELKSNAARAEARILYDPIQKYMAGIQTLNPEIQTYKPVLDSAGNISTSEQLIECIESGKLYDKSVMKTICAHCNKPVYKDYVATCSKTGKQYARSYVSTDELTGKPVYRQLLQRCPASGKFTLKENLKPCPGCGTKIIPSAVKRSFHSGKLRVHCACCPKPNLSR